MNLNTWALQVNENVVVLEHICQHSELHSWKYAPNAIINERMLFALSLSHSIAQNKQNQVKLTIYNNGPENVERMKMMWTNHIMREILAVYCCYYHIIYCYYCYYFLLMRRTELSCNCEFESYCLLWEKLTFNFTCKPINVSLSSKWWV